MERTDAADQPTITPATGENKVKLAHCVSLIKHSDSAIRPRPANYRGADPARQAWNRWVICAKGEYSVHPGTTERVQTGWTLHTYPADAYSLELRLTEWAARAGLLLTNPTLDTLTRFGTEADISPIVYNTKISGIVRVRPTDTFFELCLIPKVNFTIATDSTFDDLMR